MSTINLIDYIDSMYFNNYFNIFDIAKLDIVFTNKKIRPNWLHLLEKMTISIKYYDDIDSIQCIYKRMQFFNYIVRRKIKLNCDYIFRVSNGVSYRMTEINMIDTQTTEDMLFSMLIKSTNLISIEISINIDWVKIIEYIPMIKKNNPKLECIYIGITNEYND